MTSKIVKVRVRAFRAADGKYRGYLKALNNKRVGNCEERDDNYDAALASARRLAESRGYEVVS